MGIDSRHSKIIPVWLLLSFLIVSLIGLSDATYLTFKYYDNSAISCPVAGGGCDKVASSQYATISDVPIALLGVFYYLIVFVLVVLYLKFYRDEIIDLAAKFTIVGFLVSLWLVYLQLFVLKAICFYCMISALTSTLLFVIGLLLMKIKNGSQKRTI